MIFVSKNKYESDQKKGMITLTYKNCFFFFYLFDSLVFLHLHRRMFEFADMWDLA